MPHYFVRISFETSRHMRRLPLVAAVVLALVFTGCSRAPDGRQFANDVDLQRAQAIWNDAWLAPTDTTTAGVTEIQVSFSNDVASGSATLLGSGEAVSKAEIAGAQAAGWRLVTRGCLSGDFFHLDFAKGSRANGDQAFAALKYTTTRDAIWTRSVTVTVPHHSQESWEDLPALTSATCQDTKLDAPTSGRADVTGAPEAVPSWPSAALPETSNRLSDAAKNDSYVKQLQLSFEPSASPSPSLSAHFNLPQTKSIAMPPSSSIKSLVAAGTAQGYTLSYSQCGLGRTVAELRKPLSDSSTLTVRLTNELDGSDTFTTTAQAVVGLADLAGPPTKATAVTAPCLASAPGAAITSQGTPWYGPTRLQRLAS